MVPCPFKFTMISIKVTKDNITRKIRVDDTLSWAEITQRLSNVFSLGAEPLMLTYVDCDNDTITLSTATELQEAIQDGVKTFDLPQSVSRNIILYN